MARTHKERVAELELLREMVQKAAEINSAAYTFGNQIKTTGELDQSEIQDEVEQYLTFASDLLSDVKSMCEGFDWSQLTGSNGDWPDD